MKERSEPSGRGAAAALLLLLGAGLAQDPEDPPPRCTYALPLVGEGPKAAYAAFKQHCAQKEWSKAFRCIAAEMDDEPEGWDPLESTCRHASLSIL